jgi:hypothetical protein
MFWTVSGAGAEFGGALRAARDAASAEATAQRVGSRTEEVERRLERLVLISEALWTLLRERTGIEEREFLDRIRELDLSDGHRDGKVRRPVTDCPSCGRVVSTRNVRCLYCEAELTRPPYTI